MLKRFNMKKRNIIQKTVSVFATKKLLNWLPDRPYLKLLHWSVLGKKANLHAPTTFNEKLQWLKLHDRKPIYSVMVDKYAVKDYIARRVDKEILIPTLGVWDKFENINFDELPAQFVLKCTHDSGGIIICRDKNNFDIKAAQKKIRRSLHNNYYYFGREWPYKHVKPLIIAEKYITDPELDELRDYKFFCFNGVCKCFKVDFDRFTNHRANYYDTQGNLLTLGETICPPDPQKEIIPPKNLKSMIALAEQLSRDIPFLRVDFYEVNGSVYFGELTFFPASGFGSFTDEKWDYQLGEWLVLPCADPV